MKKIITFWNYFKKNEQEILNAILLGINTEKTLSQITKKMDYVSRRIGYIIKAPKTINDKFIIIFTGNGYRKLFAKIIALENQAPVLLNFSAQAFIKPLEDATKFINGTDEPCNCGNYEIKISELQIALLDYNIETKQIKLNIYLPDYNELKHFEDLKHNINWIVMQIIGEIAFHRHIKQIQLNQMLLEQKGLLNLIELPDFIEYLYKINSRNKKRQV
ncbi:hypothetical protein [Flavobacterium sp.]|uniref:hypothetical protein n=1 Tax=Flavobacterium sp. TaxID=239 RepID=UPI00286DB10F|nr:hypothetical protein [Flavobacterium sp.]